ncbi:hypothetical protein IG631_15685 [Alternaria alternata]|nr:hypothetical protein IG631_15685 [Alternaria alternata]
MTMAESALPRASPHQASCSASDAKLTRCQMPKRSTYRSHRYEVPTLHQIVGIAMSSVVGVQ